VSSCFVKREVETELTKGDHLHEKKKERNKERGMNEEKRGFGLVSSLPTPLTIW
jgi:hypothetical protein